MCLSHHTLVVQQPTHSRSGRPLVGLVCGSIRWPSDLGLGGLGNRSIGPICHALDGSGPRSAGRSAGVLQEKGPNGDVVEWVTLIGPYRAWVMHITCYHVLVQLLLL